jgi:DNA invertase Pin-like site-specific DNA recombinase
MAETHPENRLIGYARVSTYGQTLDVRLEQLRAAGCGRRNIYGEKMTGASLTGCSASWVPATW